MSTSAQVSTERNPKSKTRRPGQLIKKGKDRYLVRIWLGKHASGKRRYWNKTVHGSAKQARELLERKLREVSQGISIAGNGGLLGDWITYWLETIAKVYLRQSTLDQYAFIARQYILPYLGDVQLSDFDRQQVDEWLEILSGRGLSPRTIRLAASVLHNSVDALVARKEIAANPAENIKLPKKRRADVQSLTADEARRLLEGIRGTRFETLWLLMLQAGLRPGEALALRWQEITTDSVMVRRSLSWTSAGPLFTEPKTEEGRRRIVLPPDLVTHLAERRSASSHGAPTDLIFCTEDGGPLEWRVIRNRHFKRILEKLGLPKIRGYDLRHTCATLLLEAGVNPVVIAERLGHKSTAFLLDTYVHVLPHQQSAAATALGRLLDPAVDPKTAPAA